jgi:hypothetical protein
MNFLYWGVYHNIRRQKRNRIQRGYPTPHGKDSCHITFGLGHTCVHSADVYAPAIDILARMPPPANVSFHATYQHQHHEDGYIGLVSPITFVHCVFLIALSHLVKSPHDHEGRSAPQHSARRTTGLDLATSS